MLDTRTHGTRIATKTNSSSWEQENFGVHGMLGCCESWRTNCLLGWANGRTDSHVLLLSLCSVVQCNNVSVGGCCEIDAQQFNSLLGSKSIKPTDHFNGLKTFPYVGNRVGGRDDAAGSQHKREQFGCAPSGGRATAFSVVFFTVNDRCWFFLCFVVLWWRDCCGVASGTPPHDSQVRWSAHRSLLPSTIPVQPNEPVLTRSWLDSERRFWLGHSN